MKDETSYLFWLCRSPDGFFILELISVNNGNCSCGLLHGQTLIRSESKWICSRIKWIPDPFGPVAKPPGGIFPVHSDPKFCCESTANLLRIHHKYAAEAVNFFVMKRH